MTPGVIPGGDQVGRIAINECVLRPEICGKGKCIDTVAGYECECDPGYRLGKNNVCEGLYGVNLGFTYFLLTF